MKGFDSGVMQFGIVLYFLLIFLGPDKSKLGSVFVFIQVLSNIRFICSIIAPQFLGRKLDYELRINLVGFAFILFNGLQANGVRRRMQYRKFTESLTFRDFDDALQNPLRYLIGRNFVGRNFCRAKFSSLKEKFVTFARRKVSPNKGLVIYNPAVGRWLNSK